MWGLGGGKRREAGRGRERRKGEVFYRERSVEAVSTGLTVDACGVLGAGDAHAPPLQTTLHVDAPASLCHRLVIVAVLCLAMAVTLWGSEGVKMG